MVHAVVRQSQWNKGIDPLILELGPEQDPWNLIPLQDQLKSVAHMITQIIWLKPCHDLSIVNGLDSWEASSGHFEEVS